MIKIFQLRHHLVKVPVIALFLWVGLMLGGLGGVTVVWAKNASRAKAPQAGNIMTFYKSPTYAAFVRDVSDAAQASRQSQHAKTLAEIFTTLALSQHPAFTKEISANFGQYSKPMQSYLLQALQATGQQKIAATLQKRYALVSQRISPAWTVHSIQQMTVNDNPAHLDYFWAAYSATGSSLYLKTMLRYINADRVLLEAGYEIVNRQFLCQKLRASKDSGAAQAAKQVCSASNFVDIERYVAQHYPHQGRQMMKRAVVISSAIWSMESNRKQDATVDQKVRDIISANPNLDYQANIQKS